MQWRWIRAVSRWHSGHRVSLDDLVEPTFLHACPGVNFRVFHAGSHHRQDVVALRKELKDARKASRVTGSAEKTPTKPVTTSSIDGWRLTVGIEIHAQLNTARKLFSCTQSIL